MKPTKEEMEERHKKFIQASVKIVERVFENETSELYRDFLICRILQHTQDQYTREDLLNKSTIELEDILGNVE